MLDFILEINVELNLYLKSEYGIIFKRIDLKKIILLYPTFNNVVDTTLCTTLANENGVKISTIEHLMGSLYGLGIDNLIVEINSSRITNFRWICKNIC